MYLKRWCRSTGYNKGKLSYHNMGIIELLDLHLPIQAVSITTKIVNLIHTHGKFYSIQLYDKVCQ